MSSLVCGVLHDFLAHLTQLLVITAAFVVQSIVSAYERHLRDYESDVPDAALRSGERGKECSNLIVLLSELYNFQVISCILLYDIIRDLLGKTLSEFRVELLLKILRSKLSYQFFFVCSRRQVPGSSFGKTILRRSKTLLH